MKFPKKFYTELGIDLFSTSDLCSTNKFISYGSNHYGIGSL